MIGFSSKGDTQKTEQFLNKIQSNDLFSNLERYGEAGVAALAAATPKETGETASSWSYKITRTSRSVRISWFNSHVDSNGTPIVILIQYGHGTRNGGYVQGRDFINPVMHPLFDQIVNDIWEKVRKA